MRLAAGLHPDLLGSYIAPPDLLAVITGREGNVRKGLGIGMRRGRERCEGVGRAYSKEFFGVHNFKSSCMM